MITYPLINSSFYFQNGYRTDKNNYFVDYPRLKEGFFYNKKIDPKNIKVPKFIEKDLKNKTGYDWKISYKDDVLELEGKVFVLVGETWNGSLMNVGFVPVLVELSSKHIKINVENFGKKTVKHGGFFNEININTNSLDEEFIENVFYYIKSIVNNNIPSRAKWSTIALNIEDVAHNSKEDVNSINDIKNKGISIKWKYPRSYQDSVEQKKQSGRVYNNSR